MNKALLLSLQHKNQVRAAELQKRAEDPTVSAEDLAAIKKEADELAKEAKDVADEISKLGDDTTEGGTETGSDASGDDDSETKADPDAESDSNRTSSVTEETRAQVVSAVKAAVQTQSFMPKEKRDKQIRKAFADFVVGKIGAGEARDLGIVTGNGGVTIPEVIATEIITYAQEENLLRKYGTVVQTKGDVKYPVLVRKANANVNIKERGKGNPINDEDIEFDEILLSPAEFDALATVTKKLIKMSGVNIEQIVIEELKKAYVRKEANYMFNGDDAGNENPGALAKKAVVFTPTKVPDVTAVTAGQEMYDTLIEVKNKPTTAVMKKSRWIMNRAALTLVEKMKTSDGFPLLRPMTQAEGGIGNSLVGYPIDCTDDANVKDKPDVPVFYFGDFSSFHIQDVVGAMELQKLVETYSNTNRIGYQIYNLLDGQLVYSPLEPTVYVFKLEAAVTPAK